MAKRAARYEPIEHRPNPFVRFVSLVFLVGLVTSLALFAWFSWLERSSTGKEIINHESSATAGPTAVLNAVQRSLGVTATLHDLREDHQVVDWNDERGIVPLTGYEFPIASKAIATLPNMLDSGLGYLESTEPVTEESIQALLPRIEAAFASQGLSENALNTKDAPYETVDFLRGFERDELKCLVTITVNANPYARVFCGTVDSEEVAQRAEVFPTLFPQYGPAHDRFAVVTQIDGDFARGTQNSYSGGGSYWVAKRVDGRWSILYGGQDVVDCPRVDANQVPRTIYGDCVDSSTNELRFGD